MLGLKAQTRSAVASTIAWLNVTSAPSACTASQSRSSVNSPVWPPRTDLGSRSSSPSSPTQSSVSACSQRARSRCMNVSRVCPPPAGWDPSDECRVSSLTIPLSLYVFVYVLMSSFPGKRRRQVCRRQHRVSQVGIVPDATPSRHLSRPGGARRHNRQGQHQLEIIVRRDTVEALEAAAQAPMHDHMLAVWPLERTDRLHHRAARAGTVARAASIHMPRIKTERAVIAVMPSTRQRPDEPLAVAALEALLRRMSTPAKLRPRWWLLQRQAHAPSLLPRAPPLLAAYTLCALALVLTRARAPSIAALPARPLIPRLRSRSLFALAARLPLKSHV